MANSAPSTKIRETLWLIRLISSSQEPGTTIVVAAATAVQAIAKAEIELGYSHALPVHTIEMLAYRGYLVTNKTGVLWDRDLCGVNSTLSLVKEIAEYG